MAKKSSIEKNNRRRKMVAEQAPKRKRLKLLAKDKTKTPEERFAARLKLAEMPRNGSKVRVRTQVTIGASASDVNGISKVEFYVSGQRICSDTASPFSCAWTVPGGKGLTYTLVAKAYDRSNNAASSSPVMVTSY